MQFAAILIRGPQIPPKHADLRMALATNRLRLGSVKKIEQDAAKACQRFGYLTLLNTFWNATKCQ
jgi:hypothetical protein